MCARPVQVRIADDDALNDNEGMSLEEINQLSKRKKAKAQATQLFMMGDIVDADAAPAENVLFVAKLNPITPAEDLEMIFARFGKVNSVEIIKVLGRRIWQPTRSSVGTVAGGEGLVLALARWGCVYPRAGRHRRLLYGEGLEVRWERKGDSEHVNAGVSAAASFVC